MMGTFAVISAKSFGKASIRLSTKNAWAKYVRNRWPSNTIGAVQAEFDLTEWEARSLVYAQASQATMDKCLDSAAGGFALGLDILCLRMRTTLEDYTRRLEEEERLEREREEARIQSRRLALSRLASRRSYSEEGL